MSSFGKVCCEKARIKGDKICDICKTSLPLELSVAILGTGGVGKSQITMNFLNGKFCKKSFLNLSGYI